MKPAILPVAALGVAMSAFFLPPVLALTGAAPPPERPRAMLVVQAQPAATVARRPSLPPVAAPAKAEPIAPGAHVTRVASLAPAVR